MKPATAIVIEAEATEQQLVERAKAAESDSHWIIGECASKCAKLHNTTVAEFAAMCDMDVQRVHQRRRVYDVFADVRHEYTCISFSHFRAALDWEDAAECLAWANEHEASVREMEAWRRTQHGSSQAILDDPEDEPVADHTSDTNEVVGHKADCASDECECDMRTKLTGDGCEACNPGRAADLEQPDRIEPEARVMRKPEVSRLPDFQDSLRAIQKLSEQFEEHGARDQLESLAKFHEARAFRIRTRLEGVK